MSDGVQIYLTIYCSIWGTIGLILFGGLVVTVMVVADRVITLIDKLVKLIEWTRSRLERREDVVSGYGEGTYGDA